MTKEIKEQIEEIEKEMKEQEKEAEIFCKRNKKEGLRCSFGLDAVNDLNNYSLSYDWNTAQLSLLKQLQKTHISREEVLRIIEDEVEDNLFKYVHKNGTSVKWYKIHEWKEDLKQKIKEIKINKTPGIPGKRVVRSYSSASIIRRRRGGSVRRRFGR